MVHWDLPSHVLMAFSEKFPWLLGNVISKQLCWLCGGEVSHCAPIFQFFCALYHFPLGNIYTKNCKFQRFWSHKATFLYGCEIWHVGVVLGIQPIGANLYQKLQKCVTILAVVDLHFSTYSPSSEILCVGVGLSFALIANLMWMAQGIWSLGGKFIPRMI